MSSRMSVVVLGGSGLVGSRMLELWTDDFDLVAPTHAQLDVLDDDALAAFLANTHAPVVVNLAAWANVDAAEAETGDEHGRVYALNARYPTRLAETCHDLDKYLVHVSTDYVFDGTRVDRPYREADATQPLGWYAATKLAGEQRVLTTGAQACVARIEMPFSAREHAKQDLARLCLARLRRGEPMVGVVDQQVTPLFLDDAAVALRVLIGARQTGVVHLAAAGWTTPFRFARTIAQALGLNADLVQPQSFANFAAKRLAHRPQHSWLDVGLFEGLFGGGILRSPEAQLEAWAAQLLGAAGRV